MVSCLVLESLRQSLIIIALIPTSFLGIVFILALLKLPFDEGAYAALLLSSGITTNSALFIISDLNQIRKNRKSLSRKNTLEEYLIAFYGKFTPILITTISSLVGIVPFIFLAEEVNFWYVLSVGTVGGLLSSVVSIYSLMPVLLISRKVALS